MTDDQVPSTMKAQCPRCDGERVCLIHGHLYLPWDWESPDGRHSQNGGTDHHLLQCRGCETVFYRTSSWNSEDLDYDYDSDGRVVTNPNYQVEIHPKPEEKSSRPDWAWSLEKTDPTLNAVLSQTYQTAEDGSLILASVGLRTALDRACELLGIDRDLPMGDKVKALHTGGWVGETEANTLGVVAEAGNAAAHRGWAPDQAEFDVLLETLEQFIRRAILSGKRALEIGPKIPKRDKGKKPASKKPAEA
ncbi:MAG: DUF4145 domain-containing protein [Verrucomicrobiaceae bacterium]|nr:MAG: DUF4145 domain-containing protein [Verrucomicrobiaceae bacterium]